MTSKKQNKEAVRALIQKYAIGEYFNDEDTIEFGCICGYDFLSVIRVHPLQGDGLSVEVHWPHGGYYGRWSWVKSIDKPGDNKNLYEAMRKAAMRGVARTLNKDKCAVCSADADLTIDHKTKPFVHITRQYIASGGDIRLRNDGNGWELENEQPFIDFHDLLADFQILCRSCNSKKGAIISSTSLDKTKGAS